MALKIELCMADFVELFDSYNRKEQFSRAAREALFSYYEELSDDMGEDINVDIVAICCDWAEYDAAELLREYAAYLPDDRSEYDTEEDALSALVEALQDETIIIDVDNGSFLVLAF